MTTLDPGPLPAPARRPAVDQLIIDLAGLWASRYAHTMTLPRGNPLDPDDPADQLWRANALAVADGWTVLYLLGQLRTNAPSTAEQAAHFLNIGAPSGPGERLPLYAQEWRRAVEDGRSLRGLLP